MSDHDLPFDDFEDDGPDDNDAVVAFGEEIAAAVEAFGVTPPDDSVELDDHDIGLGGDAA